MKLTKHDRSRIVKAVMEDIPVVDYDAQFASLVKEGLVQIVPAAVVELLNDPQGHKYLNVEEVSTRIPNDDTTDRWERYTTLSAEITGAPSGLEVSSLPRACRDRIAALLTLKQRGESARRKVERDLEAQLYLCRTIKQARDKLPAIARYIDTLLGVSHPGSPNELADALEQAGWKSPTA